MHRTAYTFHGMFAGPPKTYYPRMDTNRVTTLHTNEVVPSDFYEEMRDRAIRWAEMNLGRFQRMGCAREAAVKRVLIDVARHWGSEVEQDVEKALAIRFELCATVS